MAVKLGLEVGDRLVATLEGAVGVEGLALMRGLILVVTSACAGVQHLQANSTVVTAPKCLTYGLQLTPLDVWLLCVTCIRMRTCWRFILQQACVQIA